MKQAEEGQMLLKQSLLPTRISLVRPEMPLSLRLNTYYRQSVLDPIFLTSTFITGPPLAMT